MKHLAPLLLIAFIVCTGCGDDSATDLGEGGDLPPLENPVLQVRVYSGSVLVRHTGFIEDNEIYVLRPSFDVYEIPTLNEEMVVSFHGEEYDGLGAEYRLITNEDRDPEWNSFYDCPDHRACSPGYIDKPELFCQL